MSHGEEARADRLFLGPERGGAAAIDHPSLDHDVQFVGDDLHPIGVVKDFAPYVAKIKQSGADSVVTGNWGQDMILLLKAAGEAGANYRYFNHSAGSFPGTVLAVSQSKIGQLTWVA